jgi:hypothetical protein
MKINQRGSIHAIFVLFLLIIIAITSIGFYAKSKKSEVTTKQEPQISNYEDCLNAGYGPPIVRDLFQSAQFETKKHTIYECYGPHRTHYIAKFERCAFGACADVQKALLEYCNTEYLRLKGLKLGQSCAISFDEDVFIKENYARAAIHCVTEDDTEYYKNEPLVIFLKKVEHGWHVFMTIQQNFSCKEMDGQNIPLAIAGACYDRSIGGFRSPY